MFAATGGRAFDAKLPAVVLIHGAGFDHSAWALHSRWFAHHGFAVLVPDLPGHGRSQGPALTSIAEMADWTAALLDAVGSTKAQLIGHSMGSLIALETAARHPARVSALGLIGTAATMTVGPDLLKAAEANDHDAIDMVSIWGLGFDAGIGGSLAPGMWMHGSAQRVLQDCAPGVLFTDLYACNAYSDALAAAAQGHGADHPGPRREGHDDAREGRQGAGLRHSPRAHRGVEGRRSHDDVGAAGRIAGGAESLTFDRHARHVMIPGKTRRP